MRVSDAIPTKVLCDNLRYVYRDYIKMYDQYTNDAFTDLNSSEPVDCTDTSEAQDGTLTLGFHIFELKSMLAECDASQRKLQQTVGNAEVPSSGLVAEMSNGVNWLMRQLPTSSSSLAEDDENPSILPTWAETERFFESKVLWAQPLLSRRPCSELWLQVKHVEIRQEDGQLARVYFPVSPLRLPLIFISLAGRCSRCVTSCQLMSAVALW